MGLINTLRYLTLMHSHALKSAAAALKQKQWVRHPGIALHPSTLLPLMLSFCYV